MGEKTAKKMQLNKLTIARLNGHGMRFVIAGRIADDTSEVCGPAPTDCTCNTDCEQNTCIPDQCYREPQTDWPCNPINTIRPACI